jgi:hypothetical protein
VDLRWIVGALAPVVAAGCASGPDELPRGVSSDWFVDRAEESGLDFMHVNGMSGRFYMVEVLAPGTALFDFDNDGDLDVYLVQGGDLRGDQGSGLRAQGAGLRGQGAAGRDQGSGIRDQGSGLPVSGTDRLYRNDLTVAPDGTRTLRFTDVTREARLATPGYGMGVAAGDFNNDGWVDLYLTKFDAPDQLLRNNGDGTFTDVADASGIDHRSWSVSAAFVDFDRDGWLDLYVGNYLQYSLEGNAPCFNAAGVLDYCTPDAYRPLPDRLYRNRGDGTFVDVSLSSRIAQEFGPALGVVTADFDRDGWIDIYVANDGQENQLWMNRRDGTFENTALISGVALPVTAKAEGSMGVDAGDFDGDGDDDLFMTELAGEGSNLYVNDGTGLFEDRSGPSALGPASMPYTGFGTAWFDFDNDGWLDVLSVNGTVQIIERLRQAGDPFPLRQRKLLLRNLGDGRFEDVTDLAGAAIARSEVSRGAAFGDVDNDGDADVLVANNNGPARLLINEMPGRHWIGLRLVGRGGRDMLGARVEVVRSSGSIWRRARADASYASSNDPRVIVGLGDSTEPPDVRITWPSGETQTWSKVPIDRYLTMEEGSK